MQAEGRPAQGTWLPNPPAQVLRPRLRILEWEGWWGPGLPGPEGRRSQVWTPGSLVRLRKRTFLA